LPHRQLQIAGVDRKFERRPIMRFLASLTLANAAESQRRMREMAERDRQVRGHPRRRRG
jgi:hypothetical protein